MPPELNIDFNFPHLNVVPIQGSYPCLPQIERFLGDVPESDVLNYYNGVNAFMAPSLQGNPMLCYLIDCGSDPDVWYLWMVAKADNLPSLIYGKDTILEWLKANLKYVVFIRGTEFESVISCSGHFLDVNPHSGPDPGVYLFNGS
jgi:hypothetical protein